MPPCAASIVQSRAEGVVGAAQLIPLILLTLVWRSSCLGLFARPLHMQSVRAAADLDKTDQVWPPSFGPHKLAPILFSR